MGTVIFPSHNDIGNSDGEGRVLSEEYLELLMATLAVRGGVYSGMAISNPSGMTIRIASGSALVNGHLVITDANLDATITDDGSTYFVYLRVVRDGSSRVNSVTTEVTSSRTPSNADRILMASGRGSAGTMTEWTDERMTAPGVDSGSYTGNGSGSARTITLPRTPRLVVIASASGSTNQILAFSQLEAAGGLLGPNLEAPTSRVYFTSKKTLSGIPEVLTATAAANFNATNIIANNSQESQSITVNGAAVGDTVVATLTDSGAYVNQFYVKVRISGANTVHVYVENQTGSPVDIDGSSVSVAVIKSTTRSIEYDVAHFLQNTSGSTQCPTIVANGFQVQAGTAPTINENGRVYNYLAIY